jgi:hypothetical protein
VALIIVVAVPFLAIILASDSESKMAEFCRALFEELREVRVSRCFYAVYFLHRLHSLSVIMVCSSPYLQLSFCLAFTLA